MALLLELEQAERIFSDYYSLLGIGIGLYDRYYKPICLIPKRDWTFCNSIRQNKEVLKACSKCDRIAFEHAKETKELYVYKCHMGLYEAVAPIIDNNMIIGYIMVGQLLDEQSPEFQWLHIKHQCKAYGFHEEELKEVFFRLKQMNVAQIEAAANIMHACVAYLCYKNIIHVERSGIFNQVHQFLVNNMKNTITQDMVCQQLRISKTTLYNTLTHQTSLSLTKYLRQLRMTKAKELLSTTSLRINQVAEEVGICDYNYFSRLFKKTYGMSPRQFKELKL
ncbi:PocR ligand-binding domain-containing protein [Vallitalea pronyensis]|uniref:PocR ligand-binding domain-containing protein n=1 Tax=Vallitalea pronyensis TaxID=1348613 RepID=A0A8J8SHU1_9FIRM|nr:PocR ligand-binding domain-containing protein [Vallitalea pronyensis]QUI24220.1 PocR ligand-binding domain-containing protein [Vallitalea pronyensis]